MYNIIQQQTVLFDKTCTPRRLVLSRTRLIDSSGCVSIALYSIINTVAVSPHFNCLPELTV